MSALAREGAEGASAVDWKELGRAAAGVTRRSRSWRFVAAGNRALNAFRLRWRDPNQNPRGGRGGRGMSVDAIAGGAAPRDARFGDGAAASARPPVRPRRRRLGVPAVLACGALVAALTAWNRGAEPPEPVAPSSWRTGFVADARLPAIMTFRQGDGARASLRYEARQRPADAERWDTLTIGEAGDDDAFFQVTLRAAKTALPKASLFVELARQSADLDAAVIHATAPQSTMTEHGNLEWAALTLSGPRAERACAGFRLAGATTVELSGIACGARGGAIDPAALARLIERLSATAAGLQAGVGQVLPADGS